MIELKIKIIVHKILSQKTDMKKSHTLNLQCSIRRIPHFACT